MIARALAEAVFAQAVAACDPAERVREALATLPPFTRGLAVGKAALAMARGAGPIASGIVVSPVPGDVPAGWRVIVGAHPEPDERSVVAGQAVLALIDAATQDDRVLALISGGASALLEVPRVPLDELRAAIRARMLAGAPIADLNAARTALSQLKGGQLAARSRAPITTLVVSDVVGDDLAVIGSGPTIGAPGSIHDARLLAPMRAFAEAAQVALIDAGVVTTLDTEPVSGDVGEVAAQLAADGLAGLGGNHVRVAWGEPTVRVPAGHGEGGRAQQLALELARRLRGTDRGALVVGSDGIDGPAPADRPAPAGAFVDGATWDAIVAAGLDPVAALARCDAGSALASVGALVVTGPTGINHADLVIVG